MGKRIGYGCGGCVIGVQIVISVCISIPSIFAGVNIQFLILLGQQQTSILYVSRTTLLVWLVAITK